MSDGESNIVRDLPGNLVLPPAYPVGTKWDALIPRSNQPDLAALWFYCWTDAPTEVLRAKVSNNRQDMEDALVQQQVKGQGFGVLLDTTGRVEYFLTRQVTTGEQAAKVFLPWFERRSQDHRKPGDRVEWDGGKFRQRTQASGNWEGYYEAEKALDKQAGGGGAV